MSRNSLGDPEKFQLASIVTKNSRTGITSNRRLLVIKGGHLFYYSNIPKSFTGQNMKILQNFHELPKCSIEIIHIARVNGFQPTSSYFSIEFQSKHMLQRQDIRKTLINQQFNFTPKNSKQLVTWQFTCDNKFIKQRWVSALNNLKEYYTNEQANMQKYFQSMHHPNSPPEEMKSSNGSSFSNRSSLKMTNPWRDSSSVSRKSYTVDNNKYGFEFKEGSPKENSNKLQENTFLKKGRSEQMKNFHNPDFELIIKQEPKPTKIQEAFKITQIKKVQQPPKQKMPPRLEDSVIEEVVQDYSIHQTPIKDISYSDSSDQMERRMSMERTLNDLKLYSETHQQKHQVEHIQVPILLNLETVIEEKPGKTSKISFQSEITPRSNYETKSTPVDKISSKSNKSQQFTFGCEFARLIGESCKGGLKFDLRLERQKQLINFMQVFKHKAINSLSDWLESKIKEEHRYRTTQQSNRVLLAEVGNIQLKVALLNTQNIVINGKQKIFFNEDSIKNIKREYKIYQNLFKLITKKLKQQPNLKLRVPLTVFLEFKGVTCIAFDQNVNQQSVQFTMEDQWQVQKSLLQEQGYKLEWFNFKQINGFLIVYVKTRGKSLQKDEQTLKQYLKKIIRVGSNQKHHNIIFQPPIDKSFLEIAAKEHASTSIESLERYVKGLKITKNLQGQCPKEEIITALQYCLFCKQIRKVYRSAQGQIDETHFFNLIIKNDPSIKNLLEQSNCPPLTKVSGQLLSFIEHYFGVVLQLDEKIFNENYHNLILSVQKRKKDLFLSSSVHCLVRQYPVSGLQIIQSYSKLNQYLQNKHYLASAALQKKRQIYYLSGQMLSFKQHLQILHDQASFHYYQSDFITCIKKCKQYEEICPEKYTNLFSIYLLMMKAYSQFSESDFSLTLRKATQMIEFNYGYQHSCLINLFSLAGFYYSKLSQKPNANKVINLGNVAIKLVKQAEQLCLKHFGSNSKQYLDILLDLSRLYRNVDSNIAFNYFQEAKKICQNNVFLATPENIIAVLSYEAEFYLQIGPISEAQTAVLSAINFFDSKISPKTKRHICKLLYELGFYIEKYSYCSDAVEKLWQMENSQKIQALQLAYKTAFRESGVSESENLIDQNDSARFEGLEKALNEIQAEKAEHQNLVQLIINAIEQKNTKLLTMIYFIINRS